MKNSCFFIGHRDTPSDVIPLLLETIEKHTTEYGVTDFYVGHRGNFDSYAAAALCAMKQQYPHIKAYLLLAYPPALRHVDLPIGFDNWFFMDGQEKAPPRYAIVSANKRMVSEVGYLIAYSKNVTNGSYMLLQYAKALEEKGQLVITNLAK